MSMLLGRQIVRQETGIAGRFRQAVAMADRETEPRFKTQRCVSQQWSRAADKASEPVKPVGRQIFVRIEKKFQQGGHDTDTGHLLLVQPPPEGPALEFPVQDNASFA